MIPLFPPLVDALRHELQEYGELLALLETRSAPGGPPGCSSPRAEALTAQCERLAQARANRFVWQCRIAAHLGHPNDVPLLTLAHSLPAPYYLQVLALAQETMELAQRSRLQLERDAAERVTPESRPPSAGSEMSGPPNSGQSLPSSSNDSAGGVAFSVVDTTV